MDLRYFERLSRKILEYVDVVHIEKMNLGMNAIEHLEYLQKYGYPNDKEHITLFTDCVTMDGQGLNLLHVALYERLHEARTQTPINLINSEWYGKRTYRGCQKQISDFHKVNEAAVSKWITALRNGKASEGVKAKIHDFFITKKSKHEKHKRT